MIPRITLQLLDSAQGHPLQTWSFENRETITLGRSSDNDVVLADPYVSRSHARLQYENGAWRLFSLSTKMIMLEGQTWNEIPLVAGTVFRLGASGCFLRYSRLQDQPTNSATMSFDATLMPILELNREKMQQDVGQIVDGAYFQQLKDARRQLRERRQMEQSER
jgi:pSer/pThr/pTyr-binding forkhead associated (FHA) protein